MSAFETPQKMKWYGYTTIGIVAVGLFGFLSLFHSSGNLNTGHLYNNMVKPFSPIVKSRNIPTQYHPDKCRIVKEISCEKLFQGNTTELLSKDVLYPSVRDRYLNVTEFIEWSFNTNDYCKDFKTSRGYVLDPLTQEEADFPLAYSIMIFKDVEMFERLLLAIYRPQNYYCIHIDKSSPYIVHTAVRAIVKCFNNVFIPGDLIDVEYTQMSSLEADLLCMKELLAYKRWKYFINLTGQEFPLQTSIEIVKILKVFNGANSMEGTVKRNNLERYVNAGNPPINVTLTKGAVHIVASRRFVDFVIYNETAVQFLAWVSKTAEPDETFFPTLNHNPQLGVPGAYLGTPESFTTEYPFLARYKNWSSLSWICAGKYVHSICINGVGDLPVLADRRELFLNKFNLDFEPTAFACMEELLRNRTRDGLSGTRVFNLSYYEELSFVKHHLI